MQNKEISWTMFHEESFAARKKSGPIPLEATYSGLSSEVGEEWRE